LAEITNFLKLGIAERAELQFGLDHPSFVRTGSEGGATKAGAGKAQGNGKMVAGRGESDEHERRVDGIILAGPRAIPADRQKHSYLWRLVW